MVDGAAVRVSLVCFSRTDDASVSRARLDGQPVDEIYTDLTARRGGAGIDLTDVRRRPENAGVAFMGDTKGGPFDVEGDQAREWLRLPGNPNDRTNADVLKPWVNGMDLTRRPAGKWIVDFGWTMSAGNAALYEQPFRWVQEHVYPVRQQNRREAYREYWWRHVEPRQGMWRALDGLSRYIATPTVAKHRLFVWCDARICPDHQLIVKFPGGSAGFLFLQARALMSGVGRLPRELSVAGFWDIDVQDDGSARVHVPRKELSEDSKTSENELMKRLGSTMTIAMMSAFACELAMKAIRLTRMDEARKSHDLWQLFQDLSEDSKARMEEDFPENRVSAEEGAQHLRQMAILRSECERLRHDRSLDQSSLRSTVNRSGKLTEGRPRSLQSSALEGSAAGSSQLTALAITGANHRSIKRSRRPSACIQPGLGSRSVLRPLNISS